MLDMHQSLSVLIVEDNPTDCSLLRYMLEERFPQGVIQFFEAHRLSEAFSILDKETIHCVILDLQLPDSSGKQTFLKMYERYFELPIIVMTNTKDRQLAIEMVQSGASDYIVKNFTDEEELFNRVLLAIERNKMQRKATHEEDFQQIILKKLDDQALGAQTLQAQLDHLKRKLTKPPIAFEEDHQKIGLGQRIAEKVARVIGSWEFVLFQSVVSIFWISLNTFLGVRLDVYPFVLMNLIMSLQAAYTAPLIMMSQNRLSQKDRLIAKTDYEISHQDYTMNQQTHLSVQALQTKVDQHDEKLDLILSKLATLRSRPSDYTGLE